MIDFDYKNHLKVDGLNHVKQLEQDKHQVTFEQALERKAKMERQRLKERDKHFDPTYMKVDLPEIENNNNMMLDPDFMIFHDK